MDFTGKITFIGSIQQDIPANGSTTSKLDFIVEELNRQYPARLACSLYGERIQLLTQRVGDIVTVSFDPRAWTYKDGIRVGSENKVWKII